MVLPIPVLGRPRPLFSLSGIDLPLNTGYPLFEPEQGLAPCSGSDPLTPLEGGEGWLAALITCRGALC
jgi:hypothetical protein